MYTWDYPKTTIAETDADAQRWRLERLLSYGLDGEKIDRDILAAHLGMLRIPDDTRAFLELLLWNKPF